MVKEGKFSEFSDVLALRCPVKLWTADTDQTCDKEKIKPFTNCLGRNYELYTTIGSAVNNAVLFKVTEDDITFKLAIFQKSSVRWKPGF